MGSSKSVRDGDGHLVLWVPAEQVQRDLWVMSWPVTYVQVTAIRWLSIHGTSAPSRGLRRVAFQIRSQGACRALLEPPRHRQAGSARSCGWVIRRPVLPAGNSPVARRAAAVLDIDADYPLRGPGSTQAEHQRGQQLVSSSGTARTGRRPSNPTAILPSGNQGRTNFCRQE